MGGSVSFITYKNRSRGMKFVFALTILVITTIAGGSVIKTQERDDLIEVFKDRLAGELLQEMIATLVGMRQNHITNKEKSKRSTSDYGGIFSSTDPYQLPFLYKRGLPNNTNPRDFIKKSLTDTRQLRFHQCYFNPISCFKK